MQAQTITIIQDLHIFAVERGQDGVRVDLVGADGQVGSVVYEQLHGEDGEDVEGQMRTLEAWARADAPVTYVSTGGTVGLVDERALFAHAFGPAPSRPRD